MLVYLLLAVFYLWAAVAGLGLGTLLLYRSATRMPELPPMPASLEQPRLLTGAGLLAKSRFLGSRRPGVISDIAVRGGEIWFAGWRGALVTDLGGEVRSWTRFPESAVSAETIDVEGDGTVEFLIDGLPGRGVSLLDRQGEVLWTYGGLLSPSSIAAGHLDGDQTLDFAVGFIGGDGVHRLDRSARPVWKKSDGNVWRVEIVPGPRGQGGQIVHSNARGEIKLRDARGECVVCVEPEVYFSEFSLCPWPNRAGPSHLLSVEDGAIRLHDTRGALVRRFDAPHSGEGADTVRGLPLVLPGDRGPGLAALVDFELWDRAILYVYDSRGKLKYQEILAGRGASLARFPSGEAFLVGGDGEVHLYRVTR